jgi:hypothetical protein
MTTQLLAAGSINRHRRRALSADGHQVYAFNQSDVKSTRGGNENLFLS